MQEKLKTIFFFFLNSGSPSSSIITNPSLGNPWCN